MSVISTSSVTEIPGIQNAISHLQDLRARMRKEEFGFHENDTLNVDVIIESIQDLEDERLHARDLLETETIKASVLRHKLQYFPDEVTKEITDAVNAARDSNAAELKRLQDELNEINEKISYCENRVEDLDSENARLHPERDNVRKKHEEIIAQLNHRMAEKASKQITLNETRDKLRDTNQRIVDLEDGIVQLKEDLIMERQEHRAEEKRLKKLTSDTSKATKEQNAANTAKKKEMDNLLHDLGQSEETLSGIKKSIHKYESSRTNLEGQERALTNHHDREVKLNQELRLKGMELQSAMEKQEMDHEIKKKNMHDRMTELKSGIEEERQKGEDLSGFKEELEKDVQEALAIRQKDLMNVMAHNEELQEAKGNLAKKAEDCGRLQQENIDMEMAIEELAETHKAVVNNLGKLIEESREQLAKERKERMELQTQREDVTKDVDDFRVENQKYMKSMNKKVSEGKAKHEQLTREGTQLQRAIKEGESNITRLTAELAQVKSSYDKMKRMKEKDVKDLEENISQMENSVKEKTAFLVVRQPEFEELEKKYADNTTNFDSMKKNVVALKNKKSGLEDTTKRISRDIEKQAGPKAQFQKDLTKAREVSISQLRDQAEERSTKEKELYVVGCKLKTVLEENDRFSDGIRKLELEIEDLLKELEMSVSAKSKIQDDISKHKGILMVNWQGDTDMQQETSSRDQVLVDDMAVLLEKTHKREEKVDTISSQLEGEVDLLASFLADVSSKRPKAMREDLEGAESPTKVIDAVASANTFTE